MTTENPKHRYLVLSRGKWDKERSKEEIQAAIDKFYDWHDRLVVEGKMISGQRLATEGKIVSRERIADGPYAETNEVIGGYWFILANDLEEAAKIGAENPCVGCGLVLEIRPLELERASAFAVTNETPGEDR